MMDIGTSQLCGPQVSSWAQVNVWSFIVLPVSRWVSLVSSHLRQKHWEKLNRHQTRKKNTYWRWMGGKKKKLHWPFNCAIWTEAVYSGISENMEMFSGLEECEQSLEQAPSMETLKRFNLSTYALKLKCFSSVMWLVRASSFPQVRNKTQWRMML